MNNFAVMSISYDVVLVSVLCTHNNKISLPERRNDQIEFVSRNSIDVERLICLIGVAAALEIFVPYFKRLIF